MTDREKVARIYDAAAHDLRLLALVHTEGGDDGALVAGIESSARFLERRAAMERESPDGPRLRVVT